MSRGYSWFLPVPFVLTIYYGHGVVKKCIFLAGWRHHVLLIPCAYVPSYVCDVVQWKENKK